jgi:hypothetical protein
MAILLERRDALSHVIDSQPVTPNPGKMLFVREPHFLIKEHLEVVSNNQVEFVRRNVCGEEVRIPFTGEDIKKAPDTVRWKVNLKGAHSLREVFIREHLVYSKG